MDWSKVDWMAVQLILYPLMLLSALIGSRRKLRAWVLAWWRSQPIHRWLHNDESSEIASDTIDLGRPAGDGTAPTNAWLQALNDYPDRYPHTLIIGPTGSGKTTFTRALLSRRDGLVAVLTPKPDLADWPGIPIVTIDDDGRFSDLSRAFVQLDSDVRLRLVAAKRGQQPGEMLTIVCDDWPVLASECGRPASDLFKLVGRLGRSLRVRLIVLSQSERVKSLGLDGEGDAVSNFTRVILNSGHSANIHAGGIVYPLDTRLVPQLANQPTNPAKWWRISRGTTVVDAAVLSNLLVAPPTEPRNDLQGFASDVAGFAMPQTQVALPIAKPSVASDKLPEMSPPAVPATVANALASIDWPTVARLVSGGAIGETAALKALGFTPSGTSIKYQAAKASLRAALNELPVASSQVIEETTVSEHVVVAG
jgi:hypothetical protein